MLCCFSRLIKLLNSLLIKSHINFKTSLIHCKMAISTVSILALAISSIYICLNIFTSSLEFKFSNKLAKDLQDAGGDGTTKFFFLIITYFGFPVVPILPVLPLLLLRDKWVPVKITFLFSISGYMIGLLKIIYGGPRPWWVGEGILVFNQCSVSDYGRPSGHAFISAYAFLLLFKYYIYDDQSKTHTERIRTEEVQLSSESSDVSPEIDLEARKKKPSLRRSFLDRPKIPAWNSIKSFCLGLGILLTFLIGVSRIYLGAHSLEQILLGWSYATILYIITIYWLDEQTDKLFLYFLDGRHKRHNSKIFALVTVIYLFVLTLPIAVLRFTDAARLDDKKFWVANMLKQCEKYTQEFPMDSVSLYLCVLCAVIFGMIYGMMFGKSNVMLTSEYLTRSQLILRKIVGLTLFAIIAAVTILAFDSKNYVVYYLANLNICLLLVVLSSYLVLPTLFRIFRLTETIGDQPLSRSTDYASY